jgi:K+-transporting ATPase ATPase C chain
MTHATHIDDRIPLRAPLLFMPIVLLGFGLLYSLVGAGLGGVLFPHTATGSMIESNGKVVGSELIAQPFGDTRYFHPRPSAANYDPMAAAGSNASRTNPDMRKRIDEAVIAVAEREGIAPAQVPGELVTTSGGGMDPHVSPQAAQVQVARVAKARGLGIAEVKGMVASYTEAPQFGLLGQPRVNVLKLNLALDELQRTQ